jgi:hypothetical protein
MVALFSDIPLKGLKDLFGEWCVCVCFAESSSGTQGSHKSRLVITKTYGRLSFAADLTDHDQASFSLAI